MMNTQLDLKNSEETKKSSHQRPQKLLTKTLMVIGRAVKTGGPTRFGPAHSGFVGPDLKSLGKKRAAKSRSEPGPVRAFVPARFLKKK
jgi:hypothetical protein